MSRLTSLKRLISIIFTSLLGLFFTSQLLSQPVSAQSGTSPLLTQWMTNTTTTAPNFSGVLVNVQSVVTVTINGVDYVRVRTTGIPSYQTVITTSDLTALNTRPLRTTGVPDFSNGVQNSSNGTSPLNLNDVVDFGAATIGYTNTTCAMQYWPYGPVCPTNINREVYFPLNPTTATTPTEFLSASVIGTLVNGTALYNWSDAMSYNNAGVWDNVAAKFELYDMDICPGHAAGGDYHHHFYPKCLAKQLNDSGTSHSPIYGFAADGYPIYGPYTAANTLAVSGWTTRNYADTSSTTTGCPAIPGQPAPTNRRVCLLVNPYVIPSGQSAYTSTTEGPQTTATVTSQSSHNFTVASGYYFQDYYYNTACSGCLDASNGHDHDGLGYHYHFTIASDGTPTFPFSVGPKLHGQLYFNSLTTNYLMQVSKTGSGSGTVTSDPSGISCGATCNLPFTYRTITLTATADAGSTFAGWSGNCIGSSTTCTVTMDAAKSVTANFSLYACHAQYNSTVYESNDASAIQTAVNAASAGATIKIAGTCAGVQTGGTVPQVVSLSKNLTLEGGHNITDWSAAADSDNYPTFLDANQGGRVVEVDSGVTATLRHLYLTDGKAYAGGTLYSGGDVYNAGNLTIEYSTLNNGYAYYGGGVHNVFNSGAQTTIRYSTLSNSQATHSGGGVYSGETNGSVTIINSTISGNRAYYNGGGVGAGTGTTVNITFSTIAMNLADSNTNGGNGGGIGQFGTAVVTLTNTLVADNVDNTPNSGAPDCVEENVSGSGGIFSSGYNFIENNTTNCGFSNSTGDVLGTSITLNTLADNGGPTLTHSLSSGSAASNIIASGTNGCNTTYTTDQRGTSSYPRLAGSSCDIGAYEGS